MDLEVQGSKPVVNCDYCGKKFQVTEYVYKNHKHYFCCKECYKQYKRKDLVNLTCPICGDLFFRKQSQVDKMKNVQNATCSKECCYELKKTIYRGENNHQYGLTGNKNSSWKSDERYSGDNNRYKLIRVEDHPFRDQANFVPEHRLIAEQHLLTDTNSVEINGRLYLKPKCVVHHIDFNKKNNDVSNLYVFESEAVHVLFHNLYKGGRVSNLDEFIDYYQDMYIDKLYNRQWLHRAYIDFDLSVNQISQWFNVPYGSVQTAVYGAHLDEEKRQNKSKEAFKQFVVQELSNFKPTE